MEDATQPAPRVVLEKLQEVLRRTSLSQSAVYAAVQRGEFPRPLKITSKAVAWITSEVDAWIAARPRAQPGRAPRKRDVEEATA